MNVLRGFSLRQLLLMLAVLIGGSGIGLVSHASTQTTQATSSSNCASSCVSHSSASLLKAESTVKEEDDDKEPTPPVLRAPSNQQFSYLGFFVSVGAFVWFSKRHKILLTTHYKS